jgi:hypothetical protein
MSATAATTAAAIYARLIATAGITAIVGQRIYPLDAPEGETAPHIIYQQLYATPAQSLTGATASAHRLYQFSCFVPRASGFAAAQALRQLVINALDGVALSTGDIPTLEDERDDYDEAARLFRADADFLI